MPPIEMKKRSHKKKKHSHKPAAESILSTPPSMPQITGLHLTMPPGKSAMKTLRAIAKTCPNLSSLHLAVTTPGAQERKPAAARNLEGAFTDEDDDIPILQLPRKPCKQD